MIVSCYYYWACMILSFQANVDYPSLNINDVEAKIRNAAQVRCARTDEYLKDFDRLRTGYITSMSPFTFFCSWLKTWF